MRLVEDIDVKLPVIPVRIGFSPELGDQFHKAAWSTKVIDC